MNMLWKWHDGESCRKDSLNKFSNLSRIPKLWRWKIRNYWIFYVITIYMLKVMELTVKNPNWLTFLLNGILLFRHSKIKIKSSYIFKYYVRNYLWIRFLVLLYVLDCAVAMHILSTVIANSAPHRPIHWTTQCVFV